MQDTTLKKKTGLKIFKRILIGLLLVLSICILVFVVAGFIPVKDIGSGVKKSCYITMRDGIKIAVRVTLPPDLQENEKVPAIMESTRYGTENKLGFIFKALVNLGIGKVVPSVFLETLLKSEYVYVEVDARGSGASFGNREMEFSKEEVEDMGQVIEWIKNQSWSNGKVGTYGISYSGNTAELAVASNNHALLAAAPLYPDFDPILQNAMPGGIFNDQMIKEWSESNAVMDSDGNRLFYRTTPVDDDKDGILLKEAIADHQNINIYETLKKITYLDDILTGEYTAGSLAPYNYKDEIQKSNVPLYVRVGWMDSGTVNGAIERFLTYKNSQTLVIGPWSHAGWFFYDPFINNSSTRNELEKAQSDEVISFFDKYLKEDNVNTNATGKVIKYYTMGEGVWKTTDTWPVKGFENKTLYFDANGSLKENKPANTSGQDTYIVDFTASTGEANRWHTNFGGGPILYPNRAEEDKKLLTYTSEALENDVEITGVPVVTLNLSSTATDGAFYVYLEDVAPDGQVTYITEGQLRAIHRKITSEDPGYVVLGPEHSFLRKDGEMLKPGENAELKIGMYAISVLIEKGHKIRISIAGHDAANFERIPIKEDPTIKVQRNNILSSYVELPVKIRR